MENDLLVDQLRDAAAAALEHKPKWTEENWKKYHSRIVVNRLLAQANEGFHVCYLPYLTEEEEGMLANQGLRLTKKAKTCDCLYSNGWFVDWYNDGELEKHQKDVEEIYGQEDEQGI